MILGGRGHFLASQMPTWSPRGHWISYVSDKSGSQEIWLWSVQDGRDVQLTDLGGRINALSWSADEQWIAFSGDRYGNFDIWKVGVDAGEVHQLTSDPRYEVFPTWSPDSNSILYVMLDESWVDHDVIQIMANGEAPRVVVRDTHFFDYGAGTTFGYPQVSPDGTTLLFRSQRTEWINYWTVPLSGGDPRSLAPAQADQSQAKWSPDGTSIVYVENHNGTHELRVVNVNDGEPTVLVSPSMGATASPDWSPDGRMVSYTRSSVTRPQDLYVVAVESGQPRPLTHSMPAGQLEERLVIPSKVTYPSSDGLRIAAYLYEPPPGPATTRYPGCSGSTVVPPHSSATRSSSMCSSSCSADTCCSCRTFEAAPATDGSSRKPITGAGDTATWKTCWQASRFEMMTDSRVSSPWPWWTFTVGLMALWATLGCSGPTPPNIVLIYIDDLGWRDLGIMGSQYYETPNIDALASQGMRFMQAYSNAPNCAPARASLLSGQYQPRHGVYTVGTSERGDARLRKLIPVRNRTELDLDIVTIAEALAPAGYVSGQVGKWHLGGPGFLPPRQGFEWAVAGDASGERRLVIPIRTKGAIGRCRIWKRENPVSISLID